MKASLSRRAWSCFLCSITFVMIYSMTNWITSHQPSVGQLYWNWELSIPLIPWMIIPYWSIDLLFIVSFFLPLTQRELEKHTLRILSGIMIAGIFFLIFPLTIGFERPHVDGVFGPFFKALHGFDKPFNLFPSLHVTLWILLRIPFTRHIRRPLPRWVMRVWLLLVGLSTLFTWQHHVIDLFGGFALAAFCFALFPDASPLSQSENVQKPAKRSLTVCALLISMTLVLSLTMVRGKTIKPINILSFMHEYIPQTSPHLRISAFDLPRSIGVCG